MAYTQVSDAIVPSVFTAYMTQLTVTKSSFVQSGVVARDSEVDALLAGAGITFNMPFWNDLVDTEANVSIGATGSAATPLNVSSFQEIGVRLSRNQSFGAADLVSRLAGSDPMAVVAARFAPYWTRQLQLAVLAAAKGVFADNTANDSADYTVDNKGAAYSSGVTDFNAEAFIDACHTMGDAEEGLGVVAMHSVVYARAKKNNLIDFIPDAQNPAAAKIPTFLGRRVIYDDGMPSPSSGVYETFIFGEGVFAWGVGTPMVPAESYRLPLDAAGGGTEALITRVEWCLHPRGHAYIGTPANGGPSNAATANNLAVAGSWDRRKPSRKMIKLARLITREF